MATDLQRLMVVTGDHFAPDPGKPGGHYNEEDFVTHRAMVEALGSLPGYQFSFVNDHSRLLEALREDPPDLVINFCDTGFGNVAQCEIHLPVYLELLGIPFTGAPPAAMILCVDKAVVRMVAESLGVPVPREAFLFAGSTADALPGFYPALIKPNATDGSLGITADAVVHNRQEASEYLAGLRATLPGCDLLYQEYLPGPEYGIGLIGNPGTSLNALPALEVDFSGLPEGLAPILSYESKTIPDSPYWSEIRYHRARLDAARETALADAARRLFARLQLRDYGRFDFRAGADGELKLMEVNPNPAWSNDGKLAMMASFAGIEYAEMLQMIVTTAIERVQVNK